MAALLRPPPGSPRSIVLRASCLTAAALALAGCGSPGQEPQPAVTVTVTAEPEVTTTGPAPEPSKAPPTKTPAEPTTPAETTPEPVTPAEPEQTFTVPDLVGMNLQLAQDTLQALDSFVLDQQDASGLGRLQVLDSNWVVCLQDPAPGSVVPVSTLIALASVKLDETCP